jgi:cytochrome b
MAGLHAAAVLYESRRHEENLILAMITGYKRL